MNGSRPPNADLYTDTALVRGYVESLADAGRKIVVLMHSYGGQVGSNALTGLGLEARQMTNGPATGGVVRLVYIAAFALDVGEAMMDMVKKMGNADLIPLAFDFHEDGTVVSRDAKNLLVGPGPGLSDEDLDAEVARFERWNGTAMYQALESCAWADIPVSYICTKNDMTVPLTYQQVIIENLRSRGKEVPTFELETGHCPQITMPNELADIVLGIVEKE
jgi:pimeloyl-ACP methyl ester carboxylesterase